MLGCRFTSVAMILAAPFVLGIGAALSQAAKPELTWAPCGDIPDTECAGLPVPIDYARPGDGTITLRLARAPAVDAAKRGRVLLLLPGGPGVGITEIMGGEMRSAQHVAEFQRQYDVVTFDPRGIGKSSPIRCDPATAPTAEMPMDRAPTQAEFEAVARANAAFIEGCAKASGALLWHLSATDTAQDIERIRQALSPNDGIVSYAASYGSAYAAAYLEAYPQKVKALILDGVVDHSVDFATFITRNVMSVQDAFERFAQWCAQEARCELHGKDLGAAFDAAIAREPKTRTLLPQLLAAGDHPELGWPALARMLAEVGRGETEMLKKMAATATLSSTDDPWLRLGKDGLFRAVICADYGPQRDYAKLAATADALAKAAPRFVWKFWNPRPWRTPRPGSAVAQAGRASGKPAASTEGRPAPQRHGGKPDARSGDAARQRGLGMAADPRSATADRRRRRSSKPALVQMRLRDAGTLPRRSQLGVVGHAVRQMRGPVLLTRRRLMASTASALVGRRLAASWLARAQGAAGAPVASDKTADALFRELDDRIEAAMKRYQVPGVAVGVWWQGREHLRGFGVTNVDHPLPVDADTLFRIGSTTKTFTATAMMRLVEQGRVDLAAPARKYLPEFGLSDEAAAANVTVRQLLNHSAGWMGDDYGDFGRGDDALARYVAAMKQLPQLTPPGQVFAYNNAAIVVAGRVIERLTGKPYETALQELVLGPLGLKHSGFFTDQLIGETISASHGVEKDRAVVTTGAWAFPRSIDSTGGLISSAREQLAYARFHLGDGTGADGKRVLSRSRSRRCAPTQAPAAPSPWRSTGCAWAGGKGARPKACQCSSTAAHGAGRTPTSSSCPTASSQ